MTKQRELKIKEVQTKMARDACFAFCATFVEAQLSSGLNAVELIQAKNAAAQIVVEAFVNMKLI